MKNRNRSRLLVLEFMIAVVGAILIAMLMADATIEGHVLAAAPWQPW